METETKRSEQSSYLFHDLYSVKVSVVMLCALKLSGHKGCCSTGVRPPARWDEIHTCIVSYIWTYCTGTDYVFLALTVSLLSMTTASVEYIVLVRDEYCTEYSLLRHKEVKTV